MSITNIKLRRSATPDKIPTTAQLSLGEVAINTHSGNMFIKRDVSGVETVVSVGSLIDGIDGQFVFNNNGILTSTTNIAFDDTDENIVINSTYAIDGDTVSLATITQTPILSFSSTKYGSAKIIIEAKDGANRHICELLVTHNGTNAFATQYGSVFSSGELANYDVDISGGNVRVLATGDTVNTTIYKIISNIMV